MHAVGTKGVTRHGLKATIIEVFANGYLVKTDCGSTHTLLEPEFLAEDAKPVERARFERFKADWPENVTLTVERATGIYPSLAPSLKVVNTGAQA